MVERSTDAKTWIGAGRVDAGGVGAGIREYTFTHPLSGLLSNGMVYYRLKMVDQDHTYAYSSIRSLRLDAIVADYTFYPNPVSTGVITLKNALSEQIAAIKLMTAGGENITDLKLENDNRCKLPKLPAGTYVLEVTGVDSSRKSEKLVISQ